MKSNISVKEFLILFILAIPLAAILIYWSKLPEELPVHWNISGEADNYGPKYLLPLLNIALYILFLIIPKIDPRKKNYTIFSSTYYKLRLIITLFFSALCFLIIYNYIFSPVDFGKVFPVSIFFLIAVMGNFMGTIRSNYFIGVRTPWTLNNDEVWKKTHYFTGKLWFFTGIVGGIVIFLLDKPASQYFAVTIIIFLLVIPVLYSYIYYNKHTVKEAQQHL